MSLRFRLVASLDALFAVGLIAFAAGTYGTYARAQWRAFDDELRSSIPVVTRALTSSDTATTVDPGNDRRVFVLPGTYAELRDSNGDVVESLSLGESASVPDLPDVLAESGAAFTVGSVSGGGRWRVIVSPADRGPRPDGIPAAPSGGSASNTPETSAPASDSGRRIIVIAEPTQSVTDALRRLILVEGLAGIALLALLSAGSWVIVRRGLQPLEHMADTAAGITGGDLGVRVAVDEPASEVGNLGTALNSMLDGIEQAFSERDATEARLRTFLADASHELRTPLTSIQGYAELYRLGRNEGHPVDQDLVMDRIESEAARMKRLVEDLLMLARLDRTRESVQEPVDLVELASDARCDAIAHDTTRKVVLDADGPVVVNGSRDQLRQAIANLVTNAIRHTPADAAIEITARSVETEGGPEGVLTVRDHGRGLSDDVLAHGFDRFWQADGSRSGEGAGLGLSIVAGIVRAHSGTVAARNHPDGGAEFEIRLPSP